MKFTPNNITSLKPGEIFVFGSNTEGRHGKGAAKLALDRFGARWGDAEGLTGQCYALPTVGHRLSRLSLTEIAKYAANFIQCAREHPELTFFLTLVGCGLAGHRPETIGPLFKDCPPNVIKPREFA